MDDMDGRNEGESGRRPSAPTPTSSYPPAPRLLDALRERLRHMHYSLRTAEAYVYWVRGFVRWARGQRHPRERGAAEIQAFFNDRTGGRLRDSDGSIHGPMRDGSRIETPR